MKELNEYVLNRLCNKQEFKNYITSIHGKCPTGLTVSMWEEDGSFYFNPEIKHYGYEHVCNNGMSDFSDLGDYEYGEEVSDEMKETVKQFFRTSEFCDIMENHWV